MKRIYLLSLLTVLIYGMLNAEVPQVVAHRGFWRAQGAAQNSIKGLEMADEIGADAVELDVWISADGVLFVNHDPTINGINIEQSDSETIASCTLSNGEYIPTLDQFLERARTLRPDIVLEVKPHKDKSREDIAVPMIVDMVKAKGLTDRTIYITFSENAALQLVNATDRPVQYLTSVEPEVLVQMGVSGADFNINAMRAHPQWIGQLRDLGLAINVWTVDKPEDIQWCIDQGVDYITTNVPILVQAMIAAPNND